MISQTVTREMTPAEKRKMFNKGKKQRGQSPGQLVIFQDRNDPSRSRSVGFAPVRGAQYGGKNWDKAEGAILDAYDPYQIADRKDLYLSYAYELYDEEDKLWTDNFFTYLVVEWLVSTVFGNGTHFEGPGAEECRKFFRDGKVDRRIENMFRMAVKHGNGYLSLGTRGRESRRLVKVRSPDTRSIRIDWKDASGPKTEDNLKYTQLATFTGKKGNTVLKNKLLVDFTLKKNPSKRYGLSLIRPNIDIMRSLMDIATDIPAAIKRVAYSPIVVRLDLDAYTEEDEKDQVLENFADAYEDNLSAITNYVIDNKHEIKLLGEGGSGARMLPIRDLIEPLLIVMFMNFGLAPGLFIQEGANKAIVGEQRKGITPAINLFKSYIKEVVETELIPLITDKEATYHFSLPKIEDPLLLGRLLIDEYAMGLISKEYFHSQMDIVDDGKTFYEIPKPPERKTGYDEKQEV